MIKSKIEVNENINYKWKSEMIRCELCRIKTKDIQVGVYIDPDEQTVSIFICDKCLEENHALQEEKTIAADSKKSQIEIYLRSQNKEKSITDHVWSSISKENITFIQNTDKNVPKEEIENVN